MFWRKRKSTPDVKTLVEWITAPLMQRTSGRMGADVVPTDVEARIRAVSWFTHCGQPLQPTPTMPLIQVHSWAEAMHHSGAPVWDDVRTDARNQLTGWLFDNARDRYRHWNEYTDQYRRTIVDPLGEHVWTPFQVQHDLPDAFMHHVRWDILAALMENTYLDCGHQASFYLELLLIYEAGHVPCGWQGTWPEGKLIVY